MDRDINFAAQCLLAMSTGCAASFLDTPSDFERNTKPLDLSSCQLPAIGLAAPKTAGAKAKRQMFAEIKKTIKLDNDVVVKMEVEDDCLSESDPTRSLPTTATAFSQGKSKAGTIQHVGVGNGLTWTVKQEPDLHIYDCSDVDVEQTVGPHDSVLSTLGDRDDRNTENNNSTKQNKINVNHVKHRPQLKTVTTKPPPLFLTAQTLLALKKKKKRKKRLSLNGSGGRVLQDGMCL